MGMGVVPAPSDPKIWEEKGTQTQTFWSDIFGWGRGLLREGVGAKKFGISFETQEIQTFWWDIPKFCWDVPEVPEKFEKKRFVFKKAPIQIKAHFAHKGRICLYKSFPLFCFRVYKQKQDRKSVISLFVQIDLFGIWGLGFFPSNVS